MSIVNIDDVSSDETIQTQQSNNTVVIYQPPPTSTQINTESMQSSNQYRTMFSSFNQNSNIMPVTVVHDPKYGHQSLSTNILDIHEYAVWSIFNSLFCCPVLGGCAFTNSRLTRRKKRHGDLIGAQQSSKFTAILNVIATFGGIFIIILVSLRFTGRISIGGGEEPFRHA